MTSMFRTSCAVALLLASATFARADFTYTTTVGSFTADAAAGLSVNPTSGTVSPTMSANVAVATITFAPTTTGSGSRVLTFTETLSGSPGTETIMVTGTLSYNYTNSFVMSNFAVTNETVVSGSGYTINPAFITYRTNNGTSTNGFTNTLSFPIVPNAVPEPASVIMLGLGLVGSAGFAARRRLARA